MKRIKLAMFAALTLAAGFFMSTPAMAQSCGQGAINEPGDVVINHTGNCVISGGITAGGNVAVSATGSITISGAVSSGGEVFLEAQGGNAETGAITSTNFGSIVIYSGGSITTNSLDSNGYLTLFPSGNLTVNGTASFAWNMVAEGSGDINITGAITGTGSNYVMQLTAFDAGHKITLGGNITAPGYGIGLNAGSTISTKSINTNGTTSFGDVRFFVNQAGGNAAFLLGDGGTNGLDGSVTATRTTGNAGVTVVNPGTGGVELDGSKINVQASAGKSGEIFVSAPNGPVKVKGHLSVNGAAGQQAGLIMLVGNTLETTGGAQISSDDTVTTNHNHYVVLTGTTMSYSGGLTLSVKGNTSSGLYLMPKGSQTPVIPTDIYEPIVPGSPNPQRAALNITSADGGTLTMNVNGRDNRVIVHGYPVTFAGGPVNINADRSNVYFQYAGAAANLNSLIFNGGTVNVYADSTISGEAAGTIHMWADKLATPIPAINLYANGASGTDGGTVEVQTANGTVPIGVGAGKIKAEASAGTGSNGKGGTITVTVPFSGKVTGLDDQESLVAKGDGSGEGGSVSISFANGPSGGRIDVNKVIKVDGGNSLLASAENNFGKIALNQKTCRQRTTGQGTWPLFYWNCANPNGSTAYEIAMPGAVINLPSGFKTTLSNNDVWLYVFDTASSYNSFYADAISTGVVGFSIPAESTALVFEATGSGVDYAPYLRGNMMHELAHLLNAFTSPVPTTQSAWTTKKNATESAMTGTWPSPQSPTCMNVFNQTTVCNANPNKSPWQILLDQYVQGQDEETEVFAIAFQNCSGHDIENTGASYSLGLQNAARSTYMRDVYDYMDQTFWPGGCPWTP